MIIKKGLKYIFSFSPLYISNIIKNSLIFIFRYERLIVFVSVCHYLDYSQTPQITEIW